MKRLRRRDHGRLNDSVEFACLLDPINPAPNASEGTTAAADLADLDGLADPDLSDAGLVAELVPVLDVEPLSRFADAGIDDDRLPRHNTRRRRR